MRRKKYLKNEITRREDIGDAEEKIHMVCEATLQNGTAPGTDLFSSDDDGDYNEGTNESPNSSGDGNLSE